MDCCIFFCIVFKARSFAIVQLLNFLFHATAYKTSIGVDVYMPKNKNSLSVEAEPRETTSIAGKYFCAGAYNFRFEKKPENYCKL